jgi:hypothetical protein
MGIQGHDSAVLSVVWGEVELRGGKIVVFVSICRSLACTWRLAAVTTTLLS